MLRKSLIKVKRSLSLIFKYVEIMKGFVIVFLLMLPLLTQAQQEREVRLLEDQQLIEAVYYHENGTISQKGTFNLKGQLHGTWESFAEDGSKVAIGSYVDGKRQGTWFFWSEELLREVDYADNAVATAYEWKNGMRLALQD